MTEKFLSKGRNTKRMMKRKKSDEENEKVGAEGKRCQYLFQIRCHLLGTTEQICACLFASK